MLKKLLIIAVTSLMEFAFLSAGVTGKIAGYVKDAKTGEPLAGVNVIIKGTNLGAATDNEGYYVILNVPVGTYTVIATMIGYTPMEVKDVKVSIDLTTRLDFELRRTAIEGEIVVVVAERPLIRKDEFTSKHMVSSEEIEMQPIDDFLEIARNQAGVVGNHFRGGRTGEVLVLIDGIPVKDPSGSYSGNLGGFTADVPEFGIQEMEVSLGGFSAEYGNVQSGIINLAMREGTERFSGSVRFITSNFGSKLNELLMGKRDWWYGTRYQHLIENDYEFNLSGPVIPHKVNFSLSGEIFDRKQGYFPNQNSLSHSYQGKLNVRPFHNIKLTLGGLYSSQQWDQFYFPASRYGPPPDYPINEYFDVRDTTLFHYVYVKDPSSHSDRQGTEYDTTGFFGADSAFFNKVKTFYVGGMLDYLWDYKKSSNMGYLVLTHTLSPKTYYELRLQVFSTNYHYATKDIEDRDGDGDTSEDLVWDVTKEGPHPIYRERELNYWWIRGDDPGYRDQKSWTKYIRWDIVSQVNPHHLIKAGVEFGLHRTKVTNVSWTLNLNTVRKDIWDEDFYDLGLYIQDKVEFEGIIALIGLRYDMFNPNGFGDPVYYPADYNYPFSQVDEGGYPILINPKKASVKHQLSPRIGISHPITDRDVLYFTYGHYFQRPDGYFLFRNLHFQALTKVGNYIGYPDIKPEKTVTYEVGIEHLFTRNLKGTITGYFKDVSNLTDWIKYVGRSIQNIELNVFTNADYGNIKGLELTLEKSPGKFFGGKFNYTYSIAKGRSSDPWGGAGTFTSAKRMNILDFDQTHTISANVTIFTPQESIFGMKILGIRPLANWKINVQFNYGSGLPYSSYGTGKVNDKRMPWTSTTDTRLAKRVKLGKLNLYWYFDIFNVFNRKNIEWLGSTYYYELTGDPSIVRRDNVTGEYIRNPQVYSDERQFRFGFSIKF